jgi:hypothetical protein
VVRAEAEAARGERLQRSASVSGAALVTGVACPDPDGDPSAPARTVALSGEGVGPTEIVPSPPAREGPGAGGGTEPVASTWGSRGGAIETVPSARGPSAGGVMETVPST